VEEMVRSKPHGVAFLVVSGGGGAPGAGAGAGAEAPLAPPRPSVASACRAGLVCCVARLAEASVHEAGARRGAAGS